MLLFYYNLPFCHLWVNFKLSTPQNCGFQSPRPRLFHSLRLHSPPPFLKRCSLLLTPFLLLLRRNGLLLISRCLHPWRFSLEHFPVRTVLYGAYLWKKNSPRFYKVLKKKSRYSSSIFLTLPYFSHSWSLFRSLSILKEFFWQLFGWTFPPPRFFVFLFSFLFLPLLYILSIRAADTWLYLFIFKSLPIGAVDTCF